MENRTGLTKEFSSGELFFGGQRCGLHQEKPRCRATSYAYRSRHRHAARPMTSRPQFTLILGCDSCRFNHRADQTHASQWCRRQEQTANQGASA